jgi:transcriptional regulator with XRE-family HTH domain
MVLLRRLIGNALRRQRQQQGRTLRDVSAAAQVSLGYLSEVERGRKEASSELLAAICQALGVSLAEVLREVSAELSALERRAGSGTRPAALSATVPARLAAEMSGRTLPEVRVVVPAGASISPSTHVVAAA